MSRVYILDTNAFTSLLDARRADHAVIRAALASMGHQWVFLSTVTVSEVRYGIECNRTGLGPDRIAEMESGLGEFDVLPLGVHVAESYGRLRAWLFEERSPRKGRRVKRVSELTDPATDRALGINENDVWLASQALSLDAVIVTRDKDFVDVLGPAATAIGKELRLLRWDLEQM